MPLAAFDSCDVWQVKYYNLTTKGASTSLPSTTKPEISKATNLIPPIEIERTYDRRENDAGNLRFSPIWKKFPLDYKYIEAGDEPGGRIAVVVVLADGYDKEELERLDMPCLSSAYEKVFTSGIWTRH